MLLMKRMAAFNEDFTVHLMILILLHNQFVVNAKLNVPNDSTRYNTSSGHAKKHWCGNMSPINVPLFAPLGKHCCGNKIFFL